MDGLVNKRYIRYWCESNQLIDPFFFEDDTVNGKNYLSMLQTFSLSEVRKLHKVRSILFQQDRAPAHFVVDVRQYLDQHFPNRWIGRGCPIRWVPRSPDLTSLDLFLWGHVEKCNVFLNITKKDAFMYRK